MSIRGLDISRYNLISSYDAVSKSGLGFAYIKATEGNYYASPVFHEEAMGIGKSALLKGYYHFFKPDIDPQQQADLFIKTINSVANDTIDLPAMLDIEDSKYNVSIPRYMQNMKVWLDYVEFKTGKMPIIYTGYYYWYGNLKNPQNFGDYLLWDASYSQKAIKLFGAWKNISIRQYTDKGKVGGLSPVDMDLFYGSFTDLWALSGEPMLMASDQFAPKAEALQKALTEKGFDTNGIDGYFGPATLSALNDYQASIGLDLDYRAGPEVWQALFDIQDV
jgi:lysozyme